MHSSRNHLVQGERKEGVRRVQGEKTKRNNPAIRRRGHNAIFCPCLFVYLFCACCACLFKCVYPLEAKKPERSSTRQPGNQATSCQLQFRLVQLVGQRTIRFYSSLLPSSVTLPFFCLHLILYFTHYPP